MSIYIRCLCNNFFLFILLQIALLHNHKQRLTRMTLGPNRSAISHVRCWRTGKSTGSDIRDQKWDRHRYIYICIYIYIYIYICTYIAEWIGRQSAALILCVTHLIAIKSDTVNSHPKESHHPHPCSPHPISTPRPRFSSIHAPVAPVPITWTCFANHSTDRDTDCSRKCPKVPEDKNQLNFVTTVGAAGRTLMFKVNKSNSMAAAV